MRTVRVYDKGSVAGDAKRLFSQDVPGRLVLVTCEDWDGERYLSNVVVTARAGRAARRNSARAPRRLELDSSDFNHEE